ncbi:hypothetical protein CF327_g7016 [Tilletia walkeri]|nr:hypothetical protein CF327_g7016 [Tilletia walkeri]
MAIDRKILPPEDGQDPPQPGASPHTAPASETQPLLSPSSRTGQRQNQSHSRSRSADSESSDGEDEEAQSYTASSRRSHTSRQGSSAETAQPISSTSYGAISSSAPTPLALPAENDTSPADSILNDEPPPAYEPRPSDLTEVEQEERRIRRRKRRRRRLIRNIFGIGLVVLVVGGVIGVSIFFGSRRGKGRNRGDGLIPDPPQLIVPANSTRIRWSEPERIPASELPDYLAPDFQLYPIYQSNASVRIPFPYLQPDATSPASTKHSSDPSRWTGSMDDVLFVRVGGGGLMCEITFVDPKTEEDDNEPIQVRFVTQYSSLELRESAKVYAVLESSEETYSSSDGYPTTQQLPISPSSTFLPPRPPTLPGGGNSSRPLRRGIIIATDPTLKVDPREGVFGISVQLMIPRHLALGTVEAVIDTDDGILEWNATVPEGNLKSMTMRGKESRISFNSHVTALDSITASTKSGVILVQNATLEAPQIVLGTGHGRIEARQLRSSDQISLSVSHGDLYAELEAPTATLRTEVGALAGVFNVSAGLSFETFTGNIDASVLATQPRHSRRGRPRVQGQDSSRDMEQQHLWSAKAGAADGTADDERQGKVNPVQIRGITDDGTIALYIDQESQIRLDSMVNTSNGDIKIVHSPYFQGSFDLYTDTGEIAQARAPPSEELGALRRFWSTDLLLVWFRSALCQGRTWIRRPGRVDPPGVQKPSWSDYGSTVLGSQRGQVRIVFE